MRRTLFLALAAAATVVAVPAFAEDAAVRPVVQTRSAADVEAAQYLKELGARVAKQSDVDAKASIARLVVIWKDKEVEDSTKKPVPELLGRYGRSDSSAVALDAVAALGEIGPAGAPPVVAILERELKEKTPDAKLCAACFDALKKLADPRPETTKAIEEALKFRDNDVVARAADAIAGYKDAPGKVRRELLEELLKQSESVFQSATGKNTATITKWQAMKKSAMAALDALSGQSFKDPTEARRWFNDNKNNGTWR